MKLKITLLILSALIGVNLTTSLAGNPSAKPKPDKTAAKQTESRSTAKAKTEETIPGAAVQPASYFYTGKPYDEDLGGYVFNYRTYSPGVGRWTTPDPKGFQDGPNDKLYVRNRTTRFFDRTGLTGKSIVWLFADSAQGGSSDAEQDQAIFNVFNSTYQGMTDADNRNPSPRYLSDGDRFAYHMISSLSQISDYATFKIINLIIHGRPVLEDDPDGSGGIHPNGDLLYAVNGTVYTLSQVNSCQPFSSTMNLLTCGTGLGSIDMETHVQHLSTEAYSSLYE